VSKTDLPVPARLVPVRDDHAWSFPIAWGSRCHVRLRVWPAKEGGPLVIATDLMLGAGLINDAEKLCRAVHAEFGSGAVVVRHFPAWSMFEVRGEDSFDRLDLDAEGVAHARRCTRQVLDALGPSVLGFPGDIPPGAAGVGAAVVGPQSAQMARVLAALLRLTEKRVVQRRPDGYPIGYGPVAEPDLDPLSHVQLCAAALSRLESFLGRADVDEFDTAAGAKRDKKLGRIVEALQKQVGELRQLGDGMAADQRERD
jgi:hypothetical protein